MGSGDATKEKRSVMLGKGSKENFFKRDHCKGFCSRGGRWGSTPSTSGDLEQSSRVGSVDGRALRGNIKGEGDPC